MSQSREVDKKTCKLEVYKLWLSFLEKLILLVLAAVIIPLVLGKLLIPTIIGIVWLGLITMLWVIYIFISMKLKNLWKTLDEGR